MFNWKLDGTNVQMDAMGQMGAMGQMDAADGHAMGVATASPLAMSSSCTKLETEPTGTTDNMMADVFTKATDKGTFAKMRGHLMNINAALRGEIAKSMQHASGELKRIISRMSRY